MTSATEHWREAARERMDTVEQAAAEAKQALARMELSEVEAQKTEASRAQEGREWLRRILLRVMEEEKTC